MRQIKKGATSQSIFIFIQDTTATDGSGLTGLVFNSSGLTAYYIRPGGSATAITLATLAAITSSFSSGGFKEADATNMPGIYRLDLPNNAVASGADEVVIYLQGAADMFCPPIKIGLVAYDPQSATSLGLSNLDVASSTLATAANLSTAQTAITAIKTKTDQLVFTIANKVDAAIVEASSFVQAAADKVWASGTRTLSAFGFTVNADVADKTGFELSTAAILAIWHQLLNTVVTAGTVGKLLKDNVNATITSRASQASVDIIDDFLDTEIAAIKAQTDQMVFSSGDLKVTLDGETVTVATNNDKTGYALSSAAIDAILDDAPSAELASVPGDTATLRLMIQFLFQYFKFKRTTSSTTETLFKANSSTNLGTATLSDSGGTVTKGKAS